MLQQTATTATTALLHNFTNSLLLYCYTVATPVALCLIAGKSLENRYRIVRKSLGDPSRINRTSYASRYQLAIKSLANR